MPFRHDGQKTLEWRRWRTAHYAELLRCGLPESILRDQHHWIRFLEEGYDEWTGWKPEMLSHEQAQVLHAFILREYGNDRYRCCLRVIEVFLGSGAI